MKIKTETQTGSIVSFKYDDEIAEITGLTTSFEPKQDGTPWQSDIEQTPYLNRRSPDLDHDYNSEMDTLIGGSIAWNQLIKNGNFADTSDWKPLYGTLTASSNVGTFTVSDATQNATSIRQWNTSKGHASHKLLMSITVKCSKANTYSFFTGGVTAGLFSVPANTEKTIATVLSMPSTISDGTSYFYINRERQLSNGDTVQVKDVMCIDLTATFGAEIADYVYSLEQSTAGSGIAWLKSYGFLTKDYYAYNDGSLVSVKTSEHRTTGKNLLDISSGTPTSKVYYQDDKIIVDGGTYSNFTSPTIVIPTDGDIAISTDVIVTSGALNYAIKKNGAQIAEVTITSSESKQTVLRSLSKGDEIAVVFRSPNNGTGEFTKCQLEFGSTATAYEPYESHSYPLDSDLELRGIPKLSNGNLYYDGDEYRADGTVTRKYGIVDLGTLTWNYDSTNQRFLAGEPLHKRTNRMTPMVCPIFTTKSSGEAYDANWNMVIYSGGENIIVHDHSYTDATAFTSAMSGVYLVYELATPTTETADPFASPQIVSPNGTEEYVDERSVPVPVGHRTTYAEIYPISGWDKIKVFVSPTEEEEDATIYTINLNGTRYGGTIDFFRGVMNVAYAYANMGSLTWSKENASGSHWRFRANISDIKQNTSASNVMPVWCSAYEAKSPNQTWNGETGISVSNGVRAVQVASENFSDATSFKNAMSGVQLVYELAEPIEVQLTAQQIEALQGQNYVWCDSGDTTLTWRHIPVLDEAVMLNGKYLELTIDGYSTLGTSGRRSLGRQLDTFSVGTADGETVKNSTFPSRKITVNYVIQTDTEEELTEAINQLANILNQDECDFVFRDEPDKFFSGYGLLDSEPKKYRHVVKGTWSLYCAYPFKRSNKLVELSSKDPTVASVDAHSATFVFDYNGTLPAHPILRAEFASAKSGGEYNEDGDCGYVAFLDAEENIIQLGNPEVLDVDQYANATLINREFDTLSDWTASGVTVGNITDQFWQNGKGQTQSYAKGTGSFTKSVGNGAINMEFDIVHRLCVSAANQTGAFECYAKNGNKIVVGFKIEKTGSGTTGTVSYILNDKIVGTDSIDLSYYNTHFGYCNRTAVYGTEYYSVYEKYYVKKKGKKKKKYHWVTYPRTVQTGWSYTQSNLNSGWSKDGSVIVFSIGNLADRTFKNPDVELTPSTSIVFNISGSFHTNAVHSCAMLSKAGVPFAEIPNVFTAGDVVEGDCNSADVMLYRKGSLEGHLEPQYGALGNDWEDFEIKPGKNIIRAVWSDWVNTSYKPEIKIIFNEVYV